MPGEAWETEVEMVAGKWGVVDANKKRVHFHESVCFWKAGGPFWLNLSIPQKAKKLFTNDVNDFDV